MQTLGYFSIDRPLALTPAKGRCRAATLSGLSGLLRERDRDPLRLLDRHGLAGVVDPEAHLSCCQIAAVLEDCAGKLGDPVFGLRLAARQVPDVFGGIAAIARAAPTVRAALDCFVNYMPTVHAADSDVFLLETRQTVELCWQVNVDVGVNEQAQFQAAMLNMKLLQALGGETLRLTYVSLSSSPNSATVAELEKTLGCKVFTRQPRDAVAFPAHALQQPVRTADPLIYDLLGRYLKKAKLASRTSVTAQVETYIGATLSSGRCTIEDCAASLGIATRTLQQRLGREGARFSRLLAHTRYQRAAKLFARRDLSLDEIAHRLGYPEQTAFGRFFKRSTGLSPQVFRNRFSDRE